MGVCTLNNTKMMLKKKEKKVERQPAMVRIRANTVTPEPGSGSESA